MRPFTHHWAADLGDASQTAQTRNAAFLAGSQSLLRDMKRGLRSHEALVDIGRVTGHAIGEDGDAIVVEAGATHAEVAASPLLRERIPMLAAMVEHIADPLVRHRATIGGAFAANEAAGDYPAAALALAATIITTARRIPADRFFTGLGATALTPGEIILAVSVPIPARAGYAKILNPAARYAMVGACAAIGIDGVARLAITGASVSGAFRWASAEQALASSFRPEVLAGLAAPAITYRRDLFADEEYRAHLVGVMARRAVGAASGAIPVAVFSHGSAIPGGATRSEASGLAKS